MADGNAQVESIMLERFSEALARIRKRRRRMWLVFFGYVPFVLLVFILGYFLSAPLESAVAVAIGWMGFCAVFVCMAGLSRCPRCHDYFHIRSLTWTNPITNKCVNCRLPLQPPTGRPELFS